MTPLILKRGDPSRRRDDDYDVLEDGKVVGESVVLFLPHRKLFGNAAYRPSLL